MKKIFVIIILLGVLMTLNSKNGYKLPADEIVKIDSNRDIVGHGRF